MNIIHWSTYQNIWSKFDIQKVSKKLAREEREKEERVYKDESEVPQDQGINVYISNAPWFNQFASMRGVCVIKAINECSQAISTPIMSPS